jgi:FKBP-type peptidyl-prolyl cis-trans isomerase
MVDGPPPAANALRPTSSATARAMVPEGSSGSLAPADTVVATRATAAKEAANATAAKEATKEAIEKKKATDEVEAKKKTSKEAAKKTESGVVTAGSGPSPALSVGVKRVAAPSGSTPPAKRRFLGS